ncbi:MAG TPA: VOC family protein [Steroidobacteraceae bacterium]|nr:VOC family protein [Steroidobacteraceae bacterium]
MAQAAAEDTTTTDQGDTVRMKMSTSPVRHIHHQAYSCWDSEETRYFYEDILAMPLIEAIVIEDPLRTDGSGYFYTFFEIGDGDTLAFFEQMSLVHPKCFNSRNACHRHISLEVEGDATVQQLERSLDAAGVASTLESLGTSLSLRVNDPNGLTLEFMTGVRRSFEYERTSRSSAHSELQRWLLHRQNLWRRRSFHENLDPSRQCPENK